MLISSACINLFHIYLYVFIHCFLVDPLSYRFPCSHIHTPVCLFLIFPKTIFLAFFIPPIRISSSPAPFSSAGNFPWPSSIFPHPCRLTMKFPHRYLIVLSFVSCRVPSFFLHTSTLKQIIASFFLGGDFIFFLFHTKFFSIFLYKKYALLYSINFPHVSFFNLQ